MSGKAYYQTVLLPLMAQKRYGFEQFYSKEQIRNSATLLGFQRFFDEELAVALIGNPKDLPLNKDRDKIRGHFGIWIEGAPEILRVYGKLEKYPSDPFGSDRAAETLTG